MNKNDQFYLFAIGGCAIAAVWIYFREESRSRPYPNQYFIWSVLACPVVLVVAIVRDSYIWTPIILFIGLEFLFDRFALRILKTPHDKRLAKEAAQQHKATAAGRKQQAILSKESETHSLPTMELFRSTLLQHYTSEVTTPLRPVLLSQLVDGLSLVYEREFLSSKPAGYGAIFSAFLNSMIGFTENAPKAAVEIEQPMIGISRSVAISSMFSTDVLGDLFLHPDWRAAYRSLLAAFEPLGLDSDHFKPIVTVREPQIGESDYDSRYKAFSKSRDEARDELESYERVFIGSPLFHFADRFLLNDESFSPFPLDENTRFLGQWIVGEPGAGKTTFISTMIAEDLKKVARNEASIFVMDSQNELIPDIARLEMFAPGRPLHNKLIYLEPNPDFPLALNIFDIDKKRTSSLSSSEERMMYVAGVEWMVDFFLKSLVKSDESSSQETFLAYVIPAVLAIPNATILTLQDLLEPAKTKGGETGYDRYKQYFGGLRPTAQRWLKDRLHSDQLKVTRDAIRSRLDGFVARGFFGDMFAHPQNKLDLFAELQNGKVILINTKGALLKKTLEPFGRYFIARLLQAAEERMFTDRGNRMPVYAYIDEASDYISNEENIEELKNKARKQKVALIIANQMESQIEMPLVREALGKMAIQCRGVPPLNTGDAPVWTIQLGKQRPERVFFPDTQFSKMPRMSEHQFQEMLFTMQDRYCSPAPDYSDKFEEPEEPQYQESPRQSRAGPPKDDEYDDRYDILQQITLHPAKARTGTIFTVKCPNGRQHQQNIPAGVQSGYRFVVKGASVIRRPDNRNGNFWVELEIPEMSGAKKSEGARRAEEDETDAKPW